MNHRLFTSLLLLALTAGARSQDVHLVSFGSAVKGPLSPTALSQRVEVAAEKYKQYAPVPRYGLYDIAYPRDAAEYAATGGHGVVLVVIYTQDKAELPLRRLYLRSAAEIIDLRLLSSAFSALDSASNVSKVFGVNRWEGLYAFPANMQQPGSDLVADYQVNRTGFVLAKFQSYGSSKTQGAADLPLAPSPFSQTALLALVGREYPGFVLPAAPAEAASQPTNSQSPRSQE